MAFLSGTGRPVANFQQRYGRDVVCRVRPRMAAAKPSTPALKCIRCGRRFDEKDNHSRACVFHGDICGNTMDYTLYEDHHFDDRSLDNKPGPRFAGRWACCQDTDADAPPCKSGWHITYDTDSRALRSDVSFAEIAPCQSESTR
mmetsp:Transcript_5332/g.15929  ORF Transcript_5332/g.15929 Transcript_5332/m.15929 type:complete len:144 (+) Transcript_5332:2-433(+)